MARHSRPTILFVDGYEHAENKHRLWLDSFLERSINQPLLRLIFAGRSVPSHPTQPWSIYAEYVPCDPLDEPEAFVSHASVCGSDMTETEIRACCMLLKNQRDLRKRQGQQTDGFSPYALINKIRRRRPGGQDR
jgi:hypothetical protein